MAGSSDVPEASASADSIQHGLVSVWVKGNAHVSATVEYPVPQSRRAVKALATIIPYTSAPTLPMTPQMSSPAASASPVITSQRTIHQCRKLSLKVARLRTSSKPRKRTSLSITQATQRRGGYITIRDHPLTTEESESNGKGEKSKGNGKSKLAD